MEWESLGAKSDLCHIVSLIIRANDIGTCCYTGTEQRDSQWSSFQLKDLLKEQLKGLEQALQSVPMYYKAVEPLVACRATLLSAEKFKWMGYQLLSDSPFSEFHHISEVNKEFTAEELSSSLCSISHLKC